MTSNPKRWLAILGVIIIPLIFQPMAVAYPDPPPCPTSCGGFSCAYVGSVNNPGGLTKTNAIICVGGSVSAPSLTNTTFNNGQKSRSCNDGCGNDWTDYQPVGYTATNWWTSSNPATFTFSSSNTYVFTNQVRGITTDTTCTSPTASVIAGKFTVRVYDHSDSDHDGLPDDWEVNNFGNVGVATNADPDGDGFTNLQESQNATDPNDYYNGKLPYLKIVSGNPMRVVGSYLALPLTVGATDSNSVPYGNAPLTFAVTNGVAQLAASTNGTLTTNLGLHADSNGLATAWLFMPTNSVGTNAITVTAVSGANRVQIRLAAWPTGAGSLYSTLLLMGADYSWLMPVAPKAKLDWLNYDALPRPNSPNIGSTNNYGTNLWLEITSIVSNGVHMTLHNTTNTFYYQLQSKTSLTSPFEPDWSPGTILQNTTGTNAMIFPAVSTNGRPVQFFKAEKSTAVIKVAPHTEDAQEFDTSGSGGGNGTFDIVTKDALTNNLTVYFRVSGSATYGADYTNQLATYDPTNNIGSATFHGSPAAGGYTVIINPQPDTNSSDFEFDESVVITLIPTNTYLVDPANASTTVWIDDYYMTTTNVFSVVTNLTGPVGIDYSPTEQALIASFNFADGGTNGTYNFARIGLGGTNAVVTNWSGVKHLPDEVKLAIVNLDTNDFATNSAGFTNGDLFFGSDTNIGWLSADGTRSNLTWCTLVNAVVTNAMPVRGSLYVDRTGVFSNQLIVVTSDATLANRVTNILKGVWRIGLDTNGNAHPTLLANLATRHLEGVITLPNDTNKWGPWAGKIITGDEDFIDPINTQHKPLIYAIDANGAVSSYALGIAPEDFDIIPTNQDLYLNAYPGSDSNLSEGILKISHTWLTNYVGDLLITQGGDGDDDWRTPLLFIVHWSGTNFAIRRIPVPNTCISLQFEHVTFAPLDCSAQPIPNCPHP